MGQKPVMGYHPRTIPTQREAVHAIAFVERFMKQNADVSKEHWARWDLRDINNALKSLDPEPPKPDDPPPYPEEPELEEKPIEKPPGVYGLRSC